MAHGFGYAIDYDAAIAEDLRVIDSCDRADRVVAMLPGVVALVRYYDANACAFAISDFLGVCTDLDFAARIADAAGVDLETLVWSTDHDYNTDDAWNLWRAFETAHGRAPRAPRTNRELSAAMASLDIMLPEFCRGVRRKAKTDLARHRRNREKFGR